MVSAVVRTGRYRVAAPTLCLRFCLFLRALAHPLDSKAAILEHLLIQECVRQKRAGLAASDGGGAINWPMLQVTSAVPLALQHTQTAVPLPSSVHRMRALQRAREREGDAVGRERERQKDRRREWE